MLDGLLGRGFSSKCKSLIKPTKSRIDMLRRKRNATLKFLKKDIADLMSNGLDINAYGRAGGLLDELRLSWNIDFVEKCCDVVLKHLSVMQKQNECPEECREAISSLMSAAAGFSDLPELRDLRHIFQEKYGDSLELFVNQEFVDNLSSKTFSMEKKVKLMEDIAAEFSIAWDSKAFELRMSRPNAFMQNEHKHYGSLSGNEDENKSINVKDIISKGNKHNVSSKGRPEHAIDGQRLWNSKEDNVLKRSEVVSQSRQEVSNDWHRPVYDPEENLLIKDNHDVLFQGARQVNVRKHEAWNVEDASLQPTRSSSSRRRERNDAESKLPDGRDKRDNAVLVKHGQELLPHGKPDITHPAGLQLKSNFGNHYGGDNSAVKYNNADLMRKDQEDITKLKPKVNNALPPPYVKPSVKARDSKDGAFAHSSSTFEGNVPPEDTPSQNRPYAGRCERVEVGSSHSGNDRQVTGPVKVDSHGYEKDPSYPGGDIGNPLPRPRSMRRRHSKSSSNHDDIGNGEDMGLMKRKPRSRRRENSRRGLQILFDDEHYQNDEEERIIDKLLMHYSKKPSSYEQGKMRNKSKGHHSHGPHEGGEFPQNGNRNGSDDMLETVPPPGRSISLPREQTGPSEVKKVFARAASFQPDRSNAARHVHPKLPDYDDLAAQFAALKGR